METRIWPVLLFWPKVALNYSPQGDGNIGGIYGYLIWYEVALNYSPQGDGNVGQNCKKSFGIGKSHLTIPRKGMETSLKNYLNIILEKSHLTIPRKGMETF